MDAVNYKNNTKLSKVLSTKLSIEDYNAFLTLTKLEYEAGLIKEESTSELLRFTIRHILKQIHKQPEYLVFKQEHEQQHQKQIQNNQQQQLHSQAILAPTITTASHQRQFSSNISRRNNFVGQKMTSWKFSSLLSTETNHHTTLWG
jgi:tRNA U34 5-carboxymethylaminomethyl modifying enzyme MnmG/GidA